MLSWHYGRPRAQILLLWDSSEIKLSPCHMSVPLSNNFSFRKTFLKPPFLLDCHTVLQISSLAWHRKMCLVIFLTLHILSALQCSLCCSLQFTVYSWRKCNPSEEFKSKVMLLYLSWTANPVLYSSQLLIICLMNQTWVLLQS